MRRVRNYLSRLLQGSWIRRWYLSTSYLTRGVRWHSSATLLGRQASVSIGRGTRIGRNCLLDVGRQGTIELDPGVWLSSDVEMQTEGNIRIGSGTTIQRRSAINGNVLVGSGCIMAPNVFISSGTHPFRAAAHLPIREQERRIEAGELVFAGADRPVVIQDDCWLGVNAVVAPGVTIGKGSVVGANSLVNRDVAPYTVVGGSPAKKIGVRLDWQPPSALSFDREEDLVYVLSTAKIAKDESGRTGVSLMPDTPLIVALCRPENIAASSWRVGVSASSNCVVASGEGSWPLDKGSSEFLVPANTALLRGDHLELRLELSAQSAVSHVVVHGIGLAGAA